jgi:hypothetical protein
MKTAEIINAIPQNMSLETYFDSLDITLNQREVFLKKKWEKIRLINQQLKESEKKRELLPSHVLNAHT